MASKSKVVSKQPDTTKTCLICGSEMKDVQFYKCRSEVIDTSFSICKNCACREGNMNVEDTHKILRLLDIPFIPEIYKECDGNDNVFSRYMLLVNNPRKKFDDGRTLSELHYDDSPTLEQVTDVDSYMYTSNEKMGELYSLFGANWKKEELLAMNKELDDMIVQYGGKRDDMATTDLYCELIRLKWLSRQQIDNGNVKDGKALISERNKMLKENNMTVQAMREKNNNESYGVEIDYAEDEPIEPTKKYFDYSGIWHMFQYLIKHMERFRGINKSSVDEDYQEMKEYTDEHQDFNEEMLE